MQKQILRLVKTPMGSRLSLSVPREMRAALMCEWCLWAGKNHPYPKFTLEYLCKT